MLTKPLYGKLFFSPDDGSGGGNPSGDPPANSTPPADPATPPKQEDPAKVTFTAEQQDVIDALIGTARKEGKAAAEKAATDAKAAADAEQQRLADEAKGEYEKAKTSLTKERDDAIAEHDALTEKVTAYETLAAKRVEEAKKALPAEALEDFPAEDDPLDQLAWMEARQALLAKLLPANGASNVTRLPRTPEASGNPTTEATSLVSRHAI